VSDWKSFIYKFTPQDIMYKEREMGMFYSYNYFRQYNNNNVIRNHKEFYKKFSNTREFGGNYTNMDHLLKNRFQNTLGHMYHVILRKRPNRILDIGCGDGINLPLANLFPWIHYEGIDYAEKTVEAAKRDYPNIDFSVGDAFELPYEDGSFDMAIMSSVLILYKAEEERVKLLKEAYRILKPGGILVANVWNDTFIIRNTIRLSRIIGRIKGDKLPKDFMGCHFNYTDVKHMVSRTSFKIKERIQTAQLHGLLECLQYITRRKYHRDFGNESIKEKELPQCIKEDIYSQGGQSKTTDIYWGLYKIFENQFAWMNFYILEK
jgi:ubiquinone/menaquinone biosynthesis C-methylase UbiE